MRLPAGTLRTYNIDTQGSEKLSPHLSVKEFRSYSATYKKLFSKQVKIYSGLPDAIEKLMDYIGADKVIIVNGYRCPDHNKAIGGSSKSTHMYGYAVDAKFYWNDNIISGKVVCCGAETVGFSGIGYMSGNSVHLDVSPTRMWYGDETKREGGAYYSLTKHKQSFYNYFGLDTNDIKKSVPDTIVSTPNNDKVSSWAEKAWNEATKSGLTDGSNPSKAVSREQAVTLIMRKHTGNMTMTLSEAWDQAQTVGYTDGTKPKGDATREEIITFIYRIVNDKPAASISDSWSWGISEGVTDGSNPKNYCSREQLIMMLSRI